MFMNYLKIAFRNMKKHKGFTLINILGLAFGLAWPIAYMAVNQWLQNFVYRIDIGIWIFFLSGLIALLTTVITVSFQAMKAAAANPAVTLRNE